MLQRSHQGRLLLLLDNLEQALAIRQEIGDKAGLCATLFNIGHIQIQNEQLRQAIATWVQV